LSSPRLIFRIEPGVKEAWRTAAREHRATANREVPIRDYCKHNGTAIECPDESENRSGKRSA
jgi:hypothetical protein